MNNYQWCAQVLLEGSFPIVASNVTNMAHWLPAENPPSYWWRKNDPLNAFDFVGATEDFPTLIVGAAQTAKVIRQTNMVAIAEALESCASLAVFSAACHQAPWAIPGRYGSAGFIASIPLPPVIEAPGSGELSPTYPQPSVPVPPAPQPTKEELVNVIYVAPSAANPDGLLVTVGVSPQGHPLVFSSGDYGKSWEVEDVTDAISAKYPSIPEYVVQP